MGLSPGRLGGLNVPARFTLDAQGALTPVDAEGKKALAERAGHFYLQPTAPDLLCFSRTVPQGGKCTPPRLALAGDCSAFALADLVAFLGQSRWTGVVRVIASSGERSIFLKDGEVRGAVSDSASDRLGEVMVRLGYVTRQRIEELLRDIPPSKIGRALVEKGALQAHDLFRCLTVQVSEIFHALMLCREGTFFVVDQEPDERSAHSLSLSMQSLLMDSIRKIDEMAHFRRKIAHGRLYVTRRHPSDGKLEKEEDLVLSLADGEHTLLEIAQQAKLTEFDATKAVFRLLEGGYASVSEGSQAHAAASVEAAPAVARGAAPAGAVPDAARIVSVFNEIFREVRNEVANQKMEKEFVAAANAALVGQALSPSPVLSGLAFDADGGLPPDHLLAQYERCRAQLGSEPLASLKQALSDVMFFLLFQAGELLEARADEELARRVKQLLAKLDVA